MTNLLYSPHFRRIEQILVSVTVAAYVGCVWVVAGWLSDLGDRLVRAAMALILVQGTVQALLIVGLVIGKRARTAHEAMRTRRIRMLEVLLSQPDSTEESLAAAERWPAEFLDVVESALQSLAGSARARVAGLLEKSTAYRRLLRDSGDSDPGRVIHSLSLLGKLENSDAREAVRRNLRHPAEAVRRTARKAIVTGGDDQLRRQVLNELGGLPSWERIVLFHLFEVDDGLRDFLNQSLASDDDQKILVALELVLTRQRLLLSAVPARLAESGNLEVRIKFFRALPFLSLFDRPAGVLQRGLEDPDWRVRASAARACGTLRATQFAGRLLEMCKSFENSAEAGHAARALAALGMDGWTLLQEAAAAGTGAGHRIAAEVMERRMVGPEAGR